MRKRRKVFGSIQYSFEGKTVVFHGSNADIAPGARIVATTDAYAMRGQLASSTVSGGYLLNSDGNAFEQNASGSVGAFRAYFVSKMAADIAPKTLKVRIGGETTGIALAKPTTKGDGAWYTLQGVRLNGKPTAPGLYIHGGGKVAVK